MFYQGFLKYAKYPTIPTKRKVPQRRNVSLVVSIPQVGSYIEEARSDMPTALYCRSFSAVRGFRVPGHKCKISSEKGFYCLYATGFKL